LRSSRPPAAGKSHTRWRSRCHRGTITSIHAGPGAAPSPATCEAWRRALRRSYGGGRRQGRNRVGIAHRSSGDSRASQDP
jgi:hypothetical protein